MQNTSGTRSVKGVMVDVTKCHPSSHFTERMYQRDAIWPTILAVILHGQEISTQSPRVARLRGFGWDVLIDGHIVVTAYLTEKRIKREKVAKRKGGKKTNSHGETNQKRSRALRLMKLQARESFEPDLLV